MANGATPESATANVDRILNGVREELLRTVAAVTETAAVQLHLEREQAAERERTHLSQLREIRDDFEAELNRLLLECNGLQRELRSAEQRRVQSEAQQELLKRKLENAERIAEELKAKRDAEQWVVDLLKRQLDEERSRSEGVLYRLAELENRQAQEFLATASAKSGVTRTPDEA